jgi:P-type Ca2+ transporter type 2C
MHSHSRRCEFMLRQDDAMYIWSLLTKADRRLAFQDEPEDTPLQIRLNRIADMIAQWGTAAASFLFVVLIIKFLVRLPNSNLSASQIWEHIMQILIVAVSIIVVAVPEGLPLAVTLSLAYATLRMIEDNNLVRILKSCETVGNATTICCDKTGTLTQNKMTVVAGTLGTADRFTNDSQGSDVTEPYTDTVRTFQLPNAVSTQRFFGELPDQLKTLLRDSIALNTTAFESVDKGKKTFIGSKTETALLEMADMSLGMDNVAVEREDAKSRTAQKFPFSSERKSMGIVVRMDVDGHTVHRLFVKGASELVLQQSTQVIDDIFSVGTLHTCDLSDESRQAIAADIEQYASHSLRTISLAYRDIYVPHWPPHADAMDDDPTQAKYEYIFRDMVFIGVLGIKDPLRPGVTKAVSDCRRAGVMVRMVTGDNVSTAKAIATECGIYTGGIIMEGPQFRKLSRQQMNEVIPKLEVLARSSPEDKRTLVKRLKHLHEIVAVTGDGTNDGPALKSANVGFSMGIAGTEVAKAASSIILMDDNFASIVKAISWGRCINDAVKKFLQVYPI